MTSVIDTAIARIQDIALASTSVEIQAAPDYPIEDASVLPLVITYIDTGNAVANDATTTQLNLNIRVQAHFSRDGLKQSIAKSNDFIAEFLARLGGDPTLKGAVDTIIFPVTIENIGFATWDTLITFAVNFIIPLKFLEAPIATASHRLPRAACRSIPPR